MICLYLWATAYFYSTDGCSSFEEIKIDVSSCARKEISVWLFSLITFCVLHKTKVCIINRLCYSQYMYMYIINSCIYSKICVYPFVSRKVAERPGIYFTSVIPTIYTFLYSPSYVYTWYLIVNHHSFTYTNSETIITRSKSHHYHCLN